MLFAASQSAVTKKPRLRLTISRSSSVSPSGFFHSSMSRCMLISCGIQWLAQPARYLSHAHLYLNGTSWLTSACAVDDALVLDAHAAEAVLHRLLLGVEIVHRLAGSRVATPCRRSGRARGPSSAAQADALGCGGERQ